MPTRPSSMFACRCDCWRVRACVRVLITSACTENKASCRKFAGSKVNAAHISSHGESHRWPPATRHRVYRPYRTNIQNASRVCRHSPVHYIVANNGEQVGQVFEDGEHAHADERQRKKAGGCSAGKGAGRKRQHRSPHARAPCGGQSNKTPCQMKPLPSCPSGCGACHILQPLRSLAQRNGVRLSMACPVPCRRETQPNTRPPSAQHHNNTPASCSIAHAHPPPWRQ